MAEKPPYDIQSEADGQRCVDHYDRARELKGDARRDALAAWADFWGGALLLTRRNVPRI